MNQQDEFEGVISKYNLWDDEFFLYALPGEVSQEDQYNAMLDEVAVCESCHRGGAEHLKENDPVAYRCGFADYTDAMREDYFEGPCEDFYDPEGVKDAINSALQDRVDKINEDML